jgi:hypothetical protein
VGDVLERARAGEKVYGVVRGVADNDLTDK